MLSNHNGGIGGSVKFALKMAGFVLAALVSIAGAGALWLFLEAAKPEHPVGFEEVTIKDPQDKPLDVGIWYPTQAAGRPMLMGFTMQWLAPDAAVAGSHLPLVVFSHGNGGLFSSHADTALALASAGFVVAAVTHTGDNAQDQSYVGSPRWLIDRPRHIHLLIDYMLSSWRAHRQLDGMRVGLFGFSAGGFTALVSIGGVPDFAQMAAGCRAHPELACSLWNKMPAPVPAASWIHDSRIKAAVIAAPGYGFAFEPHGLAQVTAAVQLWNGTEDHNVPYVTNEAMIRRFLPVPPEYHAVRGAGHYAFLRPCPSWLIPALCRDPDGFDRVRFHREFNRSVVAFFQDELAK